MYEKFVPVIKLDEITSTEEATLAALVALANSSAGQFIRKESGSFVNSTLSETITLGGISDVTITTQATGDLLVFNGSVWVNLPTTVSGYILTSQGVGSMPAWTSVGAGTVTSVSVVTANGVSGSVATATTTPAITLTLGAITPSSVVSTGALTGTAITGTSFVIGANTLTTSEWAFLDGQNQAVASTSSPTFVNLSITSFASNWTNAGRTVADAGILTTVDINGGTLDAVVIGGASAAAATITTLIITSFGGNWTNAGRTVADMGILTTVDINGGTVDGVTIGGAAAGAITGTTITANTGFMPDADGGAYLGQAGTAFSNLFLAEGGVINWDSSDLTLTQTGNSLALAGGSFTGRIDPRVVSMSDATSFTPTGDTADQNTQANTQATGTLTANAPSGTPVNGQKLIIRIKSTNVQTFAWNAIYRGSNTVVLPVATTGSSKTDYFGFIYNAADTLWDCVSAVYGYT